MASNPSTKSKATTASLGDAKSNPAISNDPAFEGNELFARKEYTKALEAYSRSIEEHPNMSKLYTLYSNRALTYLRLDRPFDALKDLDAGLKLEPNYDKLIYRKCKALLAMRRFSDAGQFLDESIGRLEHLTADKDFKKLIAYMNRLKAEYERGQFDLPAMIEETKKSKFLDNHADYYAWNKIEIRQVEGKGRGLVAKEKIEAGELLIACKAFVFGDAENEGVPNPTGGYGADFLSFVPMVKKAREILTKRPDLAKEFYGLHTIGAKSSHSETWTEGESKLIDMRRIKDVIRSNHIGADVVFNGADTSLPSTGEVDGGLWLIPSYINHACIDLKCSRYFVGDYMFIRATKSIEKDEEILFPYLSSWQAYSKRQIMFRAQGFDCQCRLCVKDRQDPIEIKQRIEEIFVVSDAFVKRINEGDISEIRPSDIPMLKNWLDELLQLRPQRDLNNLSFRIQQVLAAMLFATNRNETVRLMKERFEYLKSTGEYTLVFSALEQLCGFGSFLGERQQEKWKKEGRRLAKLWYGDERMADLIR